MRRISPWLYALSMVLCSGALCATAYAQTLPVALDQDGWTLTIGGDANWFGLTAPTPTTHDGVDAARSGAVADGQISTMATTHTFVAGEDYVSFWWKVDSEAGFDFLEFRVDGFSKAQISGTVADWPTVDGWRQKFIPVTPGTHTLTWIYRKDIYPGSSGGADAGWVDQVALLPASAVPNYSLSVASTNPASGAWVTVSPADTGSNGSGATPFARTYKAGTSVNLTAPSSMAAYTRLSWAGCDSTSGSGGCVVEVNANRTVTAAYLPAGSISGTVTSGGTGLANVAVLVCPNLPGSCTSALTGASGVYTATGLAAGTYTIFFDRAGYAREFFDNAGGENDASAVAVVTGSTTTGIDAILAPEGKISGTVNGNVGAEGKRMDYTVIGDHVNLASRVESLTKKYQARILISEHTLQAIRPVIDRGGFGHVTVRALEMVAVKGKEQAVGIYEFAVGAQGTKTTVDERLADGVVRMAEK